MHPALTALTACGAVCAALHGLGQEGSPKRRNPTAPTRQSRLHPCVRVTLVRLPLAPVATRAGVGSREREARFLSLAVGRWVTAAPGTESGQHTCMSGVIYDRHGLYVLSEYRLSGVHTDFAIGTRGGARKFTCVISLVGPAQCVNKVQADHSFRMMARSIVRSAYRTGSGPCPPAREPDRRHN